MTGLAVQVAVLLDSKVLLVQRRDFEVWGLPGGRMETGESPSESAVREVREETGLEVQLTALVGLYSMPKWVAFDTTVAVFAAELLGGDMLPDLVETVDVGFFAQHELPEPLMWWHRQRIHDAMAGIGGSAVWTQDAPWHQDIKSSEDFHERQKQSGLSAYEFFERMALKGPEIVNVKGKVVSS